MQFPGVLPRLRSDPGLDHLPPRARAAFAAKCARSVEEVYITGGWGNHRERGRLCAAITVAERFSVGVHFVPADVTSAADAAMAVADEAERAASAEVQYTHHPANRASTAAARAAAEAARTVLSPEYGPRVLKSVAEAISEFGESDPVSVAAVHEIEQAYSHIRTALADPLVTGQALRPPTLRPRDHHACFAEILTLDEIVSRRATLGRVACTSGFFDPIHPGHLRLLLAAGLFADTLVVLVSDDEALRKKRTVGEGDGMIEGRPFMNQDTRCRIVAAVRGVDFVVQYRNEPDGNVNGALTALWPAVFLKGGDRVDAASIPEWDRCKELGIEVVVPEECRGKPPGEGSRDFLADWVAHSTHARPS